MKDKIQQKIFLVNSSAEMKKESPEARNKEWNDLSENDVMFAMFPTADRKKAQKGSLLRVWKPRHYDLGSVQVWKLELSYVGKAWPQKSALPMKTAIERSLPTCLPRGKEVCRSSRWGVGRLLWANLLHPWENVNIFARLRFLLCRNKLQ